MNNGEFKNFYPAEKPEYIKKTKNIKNIKMMNIGQILLICFLYAVIFLQTAGIISNLSALNRNHTIQIDQNPDNMDQTPVSQSNTGDEQNNIENNINHIDSIDNIDNIDIGGGETNSGIIFILGENGGKLALLSPDGQIVYEIFDVYINTLPDFDKNLLINGIKIKTTDELRSLLEDYNS